MPTRIVRVLKPVIDIAIPCDVLAEAPDEREAVRKIGYIGRGAAIFQVSKIYIYRHSLGLNRDKAEFIAKNLQYLATPPYLRKDLFKLDPDLRLAGLLPPLKTPNHAPRERPSPGDLREGIVVKWDGYFSIVKIGDGLFVKVPRPLPIGSRVVVQVDAETQREDTFRGHVVPRDKLNVYWCFDVEVLDLRTLFSKYDYVILTGREGVDLRKAYDELRHEFTKRDRVLVVFGSPTHGVDEILKNEGLEEMLNRHPFINFIPGQGVEAVRTEEAIIAVLSILNLIRYIHGGR